MYYVVSMTTITTNSLRHFFFKNTSKLANCSTHGEVKLGMYAYYTIFMMITCLHDDRILFEKASGNFP